jgi:hypothetical protein
MFRAVRTLSILVGLIANLIPLYGVLYWHWDTFQLLMLYWMETVFIAFAPLLIVISLKTPAEMTTSIRGASFKCMTLSSGNTSVTR